PPLSPCSCPIRPISSSTPFPYTTLFRSVPLGLLDIVVAGGTLALGLHLVGNVSVEAAERRSTLVGQLRFAATLQDIRTVIVLRRDRKSTRLNSSHLGISYAVFCLKKKKR